MLQPKESRMDCEACQATYKPFGDKPPCETCNKIPPDLMPKNFTAWTLWSLVNSTDRPVGFGIAGISILAMERVCLMYDATFEDFEKMLLIEKKATERWRSEEKDRQRKEEIKRKSKSKRGKEVAFKG